MMEQRQSTRPQLDMAQLTLGDGCFALMTRSSRLGIVAAGQCFQGPFALDTFRECRYSPIV